MKPTAIVLCALSAFVLLLGCESTMVNLNNTGTADTVDTADKVFATDTWDTAPRPLASSLEDTDTCANLDLTLERQPVTILLLIDHSASMDLQLGDNDTRWSVLVKALLGTVADPDAGIVWQLENRVSFGMMLFTAVRNEPESCPLLTTVEPALFNGKAISRICRADDETYKGASPVPEAVDAAVALLSQMKGPGRKVIVLASDGLPQTCQTLAQADDAAGRDAAVKAVQDAHAAGVTTFVIGVGDEASDAHLQEVANAGVGLPPNGAEQADFHQGSTENSLLDGLNQVIRMESRSCVYELNGKGVAEGYEEAGQVLIDGKPLAYGDETAGWRLKSPSEIELLGEACDLIQTGDHHLRADFPCEVIITID